MKQHEIMKNFKIQQVFKGYNEISIFTLNSLLMNLLDTENNLIKNNTLLVNGDDEACKIMIEDTK